MRAREDIARELAIVEAELTQATAKLISAICGVQKEFPDGYEKDALLALGYARLFDTVKSLKTLAGVQ